MIGPATDRLQGACSSASAVVVLTSTGGLRRGYLDLVRNAIGGATTVISVSDVPCEPGLQDASEADCLDGNLCDSVIVAIGGGSVIDFAKLFRSQVLHGQEAVRRHLEAGDFLPTDNGTLPILAIPTTAGTGSEVTSFATLWDKKNGVKYSLDSPKNRPQTCILDTSLLASLRGDALINPLLDAVSHSMESLWNINKDEKSSEFAMKALLGLESVLTEFVHEGSIHSLDLLQISSHFAGHAIAVTRTALAHAISYPLTMRFGVPHGLAASCTLPRLIGIPKVRETLKDDELAAMDSVADKLRRLDLSERLAQYGSLQQMAELASLDSLNSRASNSSFRLNREEVAGLLPT